MTDLKIQKLAEWYRAEFDRRTKAVEDGTAKLDWIVPDYRVSRSEVDAYAASIGITLSVQDNIDLFQYLNKGTT